MCIGLNVCDMFAVFCVSELKFMFLTILASQNVKLGLKALEIFGNCQGPVGLSKRMPKTSKSVKIWT